jgi:adenosylcobyric acid synthase
MGSRGKVLMIQGTASSVGKSLLTAALCRIFRQDGLRVVPFKAQNMSNNAFVTPDGGEIGRAQAVQAEAAGVTPQVDMNPVLLKPEADARSQVILHGRSLGAYPARAYFLLKEKLWLGITASLDRLRDQYDLVVIEGAGSPAEINLRAHDIVNMRVARHAGSPVLLVGDIDRGGVFAHLYGTVELLEPEERALVKGFIINKFRGDPALIDPGPALLEARTAIPTLGIVPYLHDLRIAEEDAVALESADRDPLGASGPAPRSADVVLDIAVIHLPRIANFDDFAPLNAEPDVRLRYVSRPADLGDPDLIILPGTKSTMADLAWLRERGLAAAILAQAQRGTAVVGICGGFQMLGRRIVDEAGVESETPTMDGLGLLEVGTVFAPEKATHQVRARVQANSGLLAGAQGLPISGYEIHMGRTLSAGPTPFLVTERSGYACEAGDGALAAGGWTFGTYIHGLFANRALRTALLRNLTARKGLTRTVSSAFDPEEEYDRLAAAVRESLDMERVYQIAGL